MFFKHRIAVRYSALKHMFSIELLKLVIVRWSTCF